MYLRAITLNNDNKLTNYKKGIDLWTLLSRILHSLNKPSVCIFTAFLYHKEQRQAQEDIECGNCMQKSNLTKNCKNEVVCYDCRMAGHEKGVLFALQLRVGFRPMMISLMLVSIMRTNRMRVREVKKVVVIMLVVKLTGKRLKQES